MSIAPTPIIASDGSIVAVFGAIIPSAAASPGVIVGSGEADSPFDVREIGLAPPPTCGAPAPFGAAAIDASCCGFAESPGAMSVESDIVVSAEGATAPVGAAARAPAW